MKTISISTGVLRSALLLITLISSVSISLYGKVQQAQFLASQAAKKAESHAILQER